MGVVRAFLPEQQQPHHRLLRLGQAGEGEVALAHSSSHSAPGKGPVPVPPPRYPQIWGVAAAFNPLFCPPTVFFPTQVWNLANCKLKTNHIGHTGYLNTVTVSPDGSLCASGGKVRLTAEAARRDLGVLPADPACFGVYHAWSALRISVTA